MPWASRGSIVVVGLVLAVASGSGGCKKKAPAVERESARILDTTVRSTVANDNIDVPPAGDLRADEVILEFVLYFAPSPRVPPRDALAGRCAELARPLKGDIAFAGKDDARGETGPWQPERLRDFGVGLSSEQEAGVQQSTGRFVLRVEAPGRLALDALHASTQLALCLAEETGALIYDTDTYGLFSVEAWRIRRVERWTSSLPSVLDQISVQSYPVGELYRQNTAGMSKFGLPDIVVNNVLPRDQSAMSDVVNIVCQTMLERAGLERPGELQVDIEKLRDPRVKSAIEYLDGAHKTALLRLAMATRMDSDPYNRLFELRFNLPDAGGRHEQQAALFAELFGTVEDEVVPLMKGPAFDMAVERARKQLFERRFDLQKGLRDGESLEVKAPFESSDGGREWMWVAVVFWRGSNIRGVLQNEPASVEGLHVGADVTVSEDAVIDYLYRGPDGVEEGNETAKLRKR